MNDKLQEIYNQLPYCVEDIESSIGLGYYATAIVLILRGITLTNESFLLIAFAMSRNHFNLSSIDYDDSRMCLTMTYIAE